MRGIGSVPRSPWPHITLRAIRPFDDFDEARAVLPRGERPRALRNAAEGFRERFKAQGRIHAAKAVDLQLAGHLTRFALGGAARGVNPYVAVVRRMLIVQFDDFDGVRRTLLWKPTVPEGAEQAPFHRRLLARHGERVVRTALARELETIDGGLARWGLRREDVDYVAFDHLHGQDLRRLVGTTKPVFGEPEPRPPLFPNARFLLRRREVLTLAALHPLQWAWYVPGAAEDVDEERIELLDRDVELGPGVALVATPGHTDGNQSLVLNTPDGIWVSSENGVCADNWHPHISRIPGVKAFAEAFCCEVVPNAKTSSDALAQYDAMVLEKALADSNRDDPRWLNILPSSELASLRRQWPVVPTFRYGGIDYGILEPPARR